MQDDTERTVKNTKVKFSGDVDIDVADRDELLSTLSCYAASIDRKTEIEKHNTGVYFQNIPNNPITGMANIDHKVAESLGYFKIDLLNVHIYEDVKSEKHLQKLMTDTQWDFLCYEEVVKQLFHVSDYTTLLQRLKPRSVEELAMVIAIIRPAKRHLTDNDWDAIRSEVWTKPEDGSYYFKKSHAISYSMAIVVHLNLIIEKLLN